MLYQSHRLRLESADRIATLWIDSPVATRSFLNDLGRAVEIVHQSPFLDVLVIRGDGPDFLSGPDLDDIDSLSDESARAFAAAGQAVLSRLEALSDATITVAYLDGRCGGAGLELALACDYRLALARPETLIGSDALQRGVLPCWGLTQRLPQLIGVGPALDLMLNERPIPARAARTLGLVDHAFGPRPAKTELWSFVADLQDRPRVPDRAKGRRGFWSRLRERGPRLRRTVFPHYRQSFPRPDQQALIRAVERGWFAGTAEGEAAERAAFRAFADDADCAERRRAARQFEESAAECRTVARPQHWGVIGMGPDAIDLALLLIRSGHIVTFAESDSGVRDAGTRRLVAGMDRCVADGWLNIVEAQQKRKATAVLTDERRLDSADVYAVPCREFGRYTMRCRPGSEWGAPHHGVTVRFDAPPLAARIVEIASDEDTAAFADGLAHCLTRCGKRVERRVERVLGRALKFAA